MVKIVLRTWHGMGNVFETKSAKFSFRCQPQLSPSRLNFTLEREIIIVSVINANFTPDQLPGSTHVKGVYLRSVIQTTRIFILSIFKLSMS